MFSRHWQRCRARREHVCEEEAERTAQERKAEKRERGSERKTAGGASIYQRRREVGGCMRRIAPYGRSLINSGRRRTGASVSIANVEATAGVPRRDGGIRPFAPKLTRSSRPYVLIWSERGNGLCHRLMENARMCARSLIVSNAPGGCPISQSLDTSNAPFAEIICNTLSPVDLWITYVPNATL